MFKLVSTFRRPQLNYRKVLIVPIPGLGSGITTLTGPTQQEIQQSLPADNHGTLESVFDSGEPTKSAADNSRTLQHWPEWVSFMGKLAEEGYLEPNLLGGGDMDAKYSNKIRTACLNFARDRFDFIRYISNKDLKAIVIPGCPSLDRKVVNSGTRLRAYLGIDEGSVCRSCFLKGHCERAFGKPLKDEVALTVDVMRVLLTYGLHSITGSVENRPCLKNEVEKPARKLIKEMVDFGLQKSDTGSFSSPTARSASMCENSTPLRKDGRDISIKQGDWICPKCSFINFARNIKCLSCNGLFEERLKTLGEHQDHLPLKKGDWLCEKCNFLNFAKNTRCLQCKEMPPKRVLSPGEWECDSCNFINFRKNMVCLKCDHRRVRTSTAPANPNRRPSGDRCYSADYETSNTLEETHHGYSDRQSQNGCAVGLNFCEDETNGGSNLQHLRKNPKISRSPITRGQCVFSGDIHAYDRRKKDGIKSNCSKVVPDVNNRIPVDSNTLDFSELDDDMDSWFGRRKKI